MEVFIPVTVLKRILSGFLRGSHRCAEMLKLLGEAHAHFKWIHHFDSRTEYGDGLDWALKAVLEETIYGWVPLTQSVWTLICGGDRGGGQA